MFRTQRQKPENTDSDTLQVEMYVNGHRVLDRMEILATYDIKPTDFQRFVEINQPRFYQLKNKYFYLKQSLDKMLKARPTA